MKKNLIAGLLISAALMYLSLRGVQIEEVIRGFKAARYRYILAVLIIIIFVQLIRSIRWGIILSPLGKVEPLPLLSVSFVGFLAIVALPARLGELARPCLIAANSSIGIAPALGTVLVERVLDTLVLMVLFFSVLFSMPLPAWLVSSGISMFILMLTLLAAMAFMIVRRQDSLELIDRICSRLPQRVSWGVSRLLLRLIEGFQVISDYRRLVGILILSVLIWLMNAAIIYILLHAFGIPLSPAGAFIVMIVLMIGIAIPAAPGFIGNWHYFCILGLGLFGIPRSEALPFAIVHHFLSIGVVAVLGLICLPFSRFSLSGLRAEFRDADDSRARASETASRS